MPTLVLRFPAGRYHATPWGQHVNEGLAEWPPSPWRLLRALLSVGFSTLHWQVLPPEAQSLLETLASVLPSYTLPPATLGQSRHYMPLAKFKNGKEDTTLVFDTWARLGDGVLAIHWDVKLETPESQLLGTLAQNLGYLGRSESWTEACLADPDGPLPAGIQVRPATEDGLPPSPGSDAVTLLAPMSSEDYETWHAAQVDQALAAFPLPEGKRKPSAKRLKERTKAQAPYPATLLDCLQTETGWLKQQGWSQPPGSRRVAYWRPAGTLEVGAVRRLGRAPLEAPVQAMLLALSLPSGNLHALPNVVRTLPQGDLIHRALAALVNRQTGDEPEDGQALELIGRDSSRRVLSGHQHAHVLPLDLDGDGHLDHILIWAPGGLSNAAQQTIRRLRRTFTKGGAEALRLAVAGLGSVQDFTRLSPPFGEALTRVIGPPEGARVWETLTPFIAPRFLKRRGRNALEGQVLAELCTRQFPEAAVLPYARQQVVDARLHHYVRTRAPGHPQPPQDVCFGLRLVFAKPVQGPLCLGYGSHFGMGVFQAIWEGVGDHGSGSSES